MDINSFLFRFYKLKIVYCSTTSGAHLRLGWISKVENVCFVYVGGSAMMRLVERRRKLSDAYVWSPVISALIIIYLVLNIFFDLPMPAIDFFLYASAIALLTWSCGLKCGLLVSFALCLIAYLDKLYSAADERVSIDESDFLFSLAKFCAVAVGTALGRKSWTRSVS